MSDQVLSHTNYNFKDDIPMTPTLESEVSSTLSVSSSSAEDQMSLSFVGCGFLSFYYLGVTACLQKHSQINKKTIFCGASSGTVAGLALCLDVPIDESAEAMLELAVKIKSNPFGIPQVNYTMHHMIYDCMMKLLPDDCYKKVSGRLFISVTRVSDGKNVLLSQFDSKQDLIRAIQCSSFMPFLSGLSPPKYKGVAYIDGAFSNNLPKINEKTITVSPWSGEFDICPMDDISLPLHIMFYSQMISVSPSNLHRITQIAFPPPWKGSSMLWQQGFNDTLRFLVRSNRISCTQCLSFRSPIEDLEDDKQSSDSGYDNTAANEERHSRQSVIKSMECHNRKECAVNESIPEAVVQVIEEANHKFNESLINRLIQYTAIKLLLLLFIPFLLVIQLIITIVLGIFMNDWSSQVFKDMLNILKIVIKNGPTGTDPKSKFD